VDDGGKRGKVGKIKKAKKRNNISAAMCKMIYFGRASRSARESNHSHCDCSGAHVIEEPSRSGSGAENLR